MLIGFFGRLLLSTSQIFSYIFLNNLIKIMNKIGCNFSHFDSLLSHSLMIPLQEHFVENSSGFNNNCITH